MKLRRYLEVCVSLRFFCDEKVHEEQALEYDKIGIDDGKSRENVSEYGKVGIAKCVHRRVFADGLEYVKQICWKSEN
jgi:hypothetical protein